MLWARPLHLCVGTHNSHGMVFFPFFFNSDNYPTPIKATLCLLLQSPVLTQDGQKHFQELMYFPRFFNPTGHLNTLNARPLTGFRADRLYASHGALLTYTITDSLFHRHTGISDKLLEMRWTDTEKAVAWQRNCLNVLSEVCLTTLTVSGLHSVKWWE